MHQQQVSVDRSIRSWRKLAAMLVFTSALGGNVAFSPTPASAADVLILGPTVGGTFSIVHKIITTNGAVAGYLGVTGLGMTADIVPVTGTNSWATPPQPYSAYKAIVLGDKGCTTDPYPVAAAEANATGTNSWSAAVTGNVIILGTDSSWHQSQGGAKGAKLWASALRFAVAGTGTGAVISLGCYYMYTLPTAPTLVPVLNGFGTFQVSSADGSNTVAIVANLPDLILPTPAVLSNWSSSAHEGFTSWPADFVPVAMVTDGSGPHNFTAADGSKGFPYILARAQAQGQLKVCKVAGPGVTPGTLYTFHAGSAAPFTVRAGTGPGGTCSLGPRFYVGSTVTVTETLSGGSTVTGISVAPPTRLAGTPNLALGTVSVTIGTGVTEVTFTNRKPTGFVEICKKTVSSFPTSGRSFTFSVNPGNLGPFVVPAGSCSPAIEVAAGQVVIKEAPSPQTHLIGCSTIPAVNQVSCNSTARTSGVTVVAGDVSTQTIAILTNRVDPPKDTEDKKREGKKRR